MEISWANVEGEFGPEESHQLTHPPNSSFKQVLGLPRGLRDREG